MSFPKYYEHEYEKSLKRTYKQRFPDLYIIDVSPGVQPNNNCYVDGLQGWLLGLLAIVLYLVLTLMKVQEYSIVPHFSILNFLSLNLETPWSRPSKRE